MVCLQQSLSETMVGSKSNKVGCLEALRTGRGNRNKRGSTQCEWHCVGGGVQMKTSLPACVSNDSTCLASHCNDKIWCKNESRGI